MTSFSVLIIANEGSDLLVKCLDSLNPGSAPWQLILVSNGLPLPQSIVEKAKALSSEVDILSLAAPESLASARNQGLSLVKYDWVLFLDEAAYVYPQYFTVALPLLNQERISVLGGSDAPAKGMNALASAWALTLASPFCTGTSYSRHQSKGKKLIPASEENLSLAHFWVRRKLLDNNLFDEAFANKDAMAKLFDLNASGAHIFYHPSLIAGLSRRESLGGLTGEAYESGYFRSKLMTEKASKGAGIYWLPAVFVLLHLLIFTRSIFFWDMVRIYVAVIIMMSLNLATRKKRSALVLHMSFLHYYIVMVYGLGFLAQRVGRGRK